MPPIHSAHYRLPHRSVTYCKATNVLSFDPPGVLAENSFDSILLTDVKDGLITYTNAAFTTLTGWAASEVLGKSPKLLQGEATDKKVIARLTKALKDGGDFEGRAINYKKDGTPFIMCVRDEQTMCRVSDSHTMPLRYVLLDLQPAVTFAQELAGRTCESGWQRDGLGRYSARGLASLISRAREHI